MRAPLPRLQDMPSVVKRRIAHHLDYYPDKISLKHCCPAFNSLHPSTQCEVVTLKFKSYGVIELVISFGMESMIRTFIQKDQNCEVSMERKCLKDWGRVVEPRKTHIVENENFISLSVEHLKMLTDNRNLKIGKFEVKIENFSHRWNSHRRFYDKNAFLSALKSSGIQLKAQIFEFPHFQNEQDLLFILPLLNPESLGNITLANYGASWDRVDFSEIAKLDQWKKARKLDVSNFSILPMESWFLDFPIVRLNLRHANLEELKRILNHFRRSRSFERAEITTILWDRDIAMAFTGLRFFGLGDYRYIHFGRTGTKKSVHVSIRHGRICISKHCQEDSEDLEEESDDSEDSDNDN